MTVDAKDFLLKTAAAAGLLGALAACSDGGNTAADTANDPGAETVMAETESAAPAEAAAEAAPAADSDAGGAEAADTAMVDADLAAAVNGSWRSDEAKARDQFRNPVETLEFFGVEPDMAVIEIWPGGGWYADILAPYIAAGTGQYIAAGFPPRGGIENPRNAQFKEKMAAAPEVYGTPGFTVFGAESEALAEAGSIDMILTFRNLHNWMGGDYAAKAAEDFYAALKPGGLLGVVDHRAADPNAAYDNSGYVGQQTAIDLFTAAGFELVEASEVNANPADTKDHPYGVWTLPPSRRSPREDEEVPEGFDRAALDAIGESDRFTLKFVKPAG